MKKRDWKYHAQLVVINIFLLAGGLCFVSCEEEYQLDEKEPEWLGESIYDYLKEDGNYTYTTQLIDDVGYTEVLSKTGSKTLFVTDDEAFEQFFEDNPWGITRYEDLSTAQKRLIINFTMINNAYLIETLANYYNGTLQVGTALRRATAISVLDSIPYEIGNALPSNQFWEEYRSTGLYLLKDATSWPMVHFLERSLTNAGISNNDFELITGVPRENNDAHIYDIKVIERDIACKNGYVHVLEDVLIPPVNIAQHIFENSNTSIFSSLLERFSAPYYNGEQTNDYNEIHPENQIDSIFEKVYFSEIDGALFYPNDEMIPEELLLPFNPGSNSYSVNGAIQPDMAVIICPTDDVMTNYFESGAGAVLKDRYGSWENIPDDIVMLLLRRHLRTSFLQSTPADFKDLFDSENARIPLSEDNITSTYLGLNGVVYHTNEVFPPHDYISVYGPVLFSEKTKVFNWAIRQNEFRLYLNSILSRYSVFVPTDEYFKDYIDPVAYAKDVKAAMKYWYNPETSSVNATIYSYNPETNTIGDSIGIIQNQAFVSARLLDLLDSHIVIDGVESGDGYYFTKGGNTVKVEGSGQSLKIQGGYDIKQDNFANVVPDGVFEQDNGVTYFIDKPIQTPLESVYKVLSETPEFSAFFNLLFGFLSTDRDIFVKENNYYGIDYNIKFFNTFNYTVYVPTNDAIQQAIDDGIILDWDQIDALSDAQEQEEAIIQLERFLRYHFQDNSVFVGGEPINKLYQTATLKTNDSTTQFGTYQNKYYRLRVNNSGENLTLDTENYGSAQVVKDNDLYNIMTRDYVFNDNPLAFREVDGTGVGSAFSQTSITTSSNAVIHQIDQVLTFE